MKVRGNTNPGTAPRIEHDVGRTGYIAVRFAENIAKVDGEENLWEYDEYLISALEVNRPDIEANPAKWLDLAKYWEAKRDAARAAALRDAELAQDVPLVASIAFVAMAQSGQLDDVTIAEHTDLFPVWDANWRGKAQSIVRDDGGLYRSIHDVTDAGQNRKPSQTPSMWTPIGDPADEWPAWSQPLGQHDAYDLGAKVTHDGKHWVSTYDGKNVWIPGVYGWTVQP